MQNRFENTYPFRLCILNSVYKKGKHSFCFVFSALIMSKAVCASCAKKVKTWALCFRLRSDRGTLTAWLVYWTSKIKTFRCWWPVVLYTVRPSTPWVAWRYCDWGLFVVFFCWLVGFSYFWSFFLLSIEIVYICGYNVTLSLSLSYIIFQFFSKFCQFELIYSIFFRVSYVSLFPILPFFIPSHISCLKIYLWREVADLESVHVCRLTKN